jgi:hypothetical protein
VDGRSLSLALAARLNEVLPEGFTASEYGGGVELRTPTNLDSLVWVESIVNQEGSAADHITAACYAVLDAAQDMVVEVSREPWPGDKPTTPSVVVEGDRVELFYGTAGGPTLTMRPIALL